jgi:hypothetical protein
MGELQMWCPAPLPEGELHRKKLRSDKYKPPACRLLEFYESDSLVEADEDTSNEAEGGDAGAAPDAGGAMKARRRTTRSAVGKQSASAAAVVVSAVKATKKNKKRKRRAASLPAVVTPSIPTPRSHEVESEEEEEKRRMRRSRSCRSLRIRRQGGRRVLLPRGSGSWCRRCQRMLYDADWRRSVMLQQRRLGFR